MRVNDYFHFVQNAKPSRLRDFTAYFRVPPPRQKRKEIIFLTDGEDAVAPFADGCAEGAVLL